jgi:transposase
LTLKEAAVKYSAIDLHSNNSVVVVTDEADRVLARARLRNDLGLIVKWLEPHREELAGVVVESTYNWYWLVDGLREAGFEVLLAQPAAVKQYEGLKHGGDESDARFLTHLLRLGILPTGTIREPEERAVRDLARKRMQLVRGRTLQVLAVENLVARHLGHRISGNEVKRLTEEAVDRMGLRVEVALAMKANVAVLGALAGQIDRLERRLAELVRPQPQYALLTSVPGIGQTLATVILLETGPIERFAGVGNYASYARCVDSARISNARQKGRGNAKNGNKYLAWAFVEAAIFAIRHCAQAKCFYERKKSRTHRVVAIKALAHKLARACYHILKDGRPFDVNRCFA